MYNLEGELQQKQQDTEPDKRPRWIALTKDRFPQETLGATLFPEALEGRSRPETVFNKVIDQSVLLLKTPKTIVLKRLAEQNITTAADILSLPKDCLSTLTPRYSLQIRIKEGLRHHLEELVILPHARLIGAIYRQKQYPVPAEREQELIDVVEQKVNALKSQKDRELLIYHFGFYDGIAKSYQQTGKPFNLYLSSVVDIVNKTLRFVHGLSGYRSLPEKSFGRLALDAIFYKELPHSLRAFSTDLSNCSDSTKQELTRVYPPPRHGNMNPHFYIVNLGEIWDIDLLKSGLSKDAQGEISQYLKGIKARLTKPFT